MADMSSCTGEKRASDQRPQRRLVVRLGTNLVSGSEGKFNRAVLEGLADEMAALRKAGLEVLVVSSGAIGAGRLLLGLKRRPASLVEKQAAAAIGQSQLMHFYGELFGRHRFKVRKVKT